MPIFWLQIKALASYFVKASTGSQNANNVPPAPASSIPNTDKIVTLARMAEIRHRVGIQGSAAEIYRLLTTDAGLSQWWTSDTEGAGGVGSVIYFRFGDDGPRFEVTELVTDRRVRWRHYGDMPGAWKGSEILFDLQAEEKQTIVAFSHYNWPQADDFLAHCSTKWGIFMMSLKSCVETGTGQPYPDDIHIDFDE